MLFSGGEADDIETTILFSEPLAFGYRTARFTRRASSGTVTRTGMTGVQDRIAVILRVSDRECRPADFAVYTGRR